MRRVIQLALATFFGTLVAVLGFMVAFLLAVAIDFALIHPVHLGP